MSNVHDITDRIDKLAKSVDKGGSPPHDGNMEARITKLENFVVDARERLTKIETRLDQTATKSDIAGLHTDIIKWVVGTGIVGLVAFITIMTFVLNNAVPKTPNAQPAPIIITVPSPQIAAPTPSK